MKPATHPTALRIQRLLAEAQIDSMVVEFEQPTRTSAAAAAAIGCTVAEIAKSVVFRTKESNQPVVVGAIAAGALLLVFGGKGKYTTIGPRAGWSTTALRTSACASP